MTNLFSQKNLTPTKKKIEWELLLSLGLLIIACLISMRYIDFPIAYHIAYYSAHGVTQGLDNVNVLLTDAVYILAIIVMAVYVACRFFNIDNQMTNICAVLSLSIAVVFFVKTQLQQIFGRLGPASINFSTINPHQHGFFYDYQWMREGSFPSGHMMIFSCLFLLLSFSFPKIRFWCYGALAILAFLLVLENYHFVSDILAGAYLGSLIAIIMRYIFKA